MDRGVFVVVVEAYMWVVIVVVVKKVGRASVCGGGSGGREGRWCYGRWSGETLVTVASASTCRRVYYNGV